MAGVLPLTGAMTPKLAMGYREATALSDTLLACAGELVRGHEFHRTRTTPAPETADAPVAALVDAPGAASAIGGPPSDPPIAGEALPPAWCLGGVADGVADGVSADPAGTGRPTLHAAYLHVHWAGYPEAARRFADAVHAYAAGAVTAAEEAIAAVATEPDLAHHGDRDMAPGLVDLAVNVRPARTPRFLIDAVMRDADWSAYPDAAPLRAALAEHHRVPVDHVLPTAGGAEAFTLVARALATTYPLVVHPQFTEPEAALRAAGRDVRRHVLTGADGFALDATTLLAAHPAADLIVVGNPTNPTSVLHPRAELEKLLGSDRTLVVDEAFMDLVPGEPETMIDPWLADPTGLLVLRSLTKTWGIAGLRLGYVVGDPALVARVAAQQPPWSVSTPAIAAGLAALTEPAQDWARRATAEIAPARDDLIERLARLGLRVVTPARAPYVLLDTSPLGPDSPREALAARGFAVRRGETFPGLGPTWIRLAVRDGATHAALATALTELAGGTRPAAGAHSAPAPDPKDRR